MNYQKMYLIFKMIVVKKEKWHLKKEFYYQYKTKALEKLQRYEECITTCEEALNNIERFHYRNDVWIKSRLYFSKCMEVDEENLESEINKYKELAFEEHHWFMYHKVSSMYWAIWKDG